MSSSTLTAIAFSVLGYVLVGAGLFGKRFYSENDQPIPAWQGKAVCIAVGFLFIAMGLGSLFYGSGIQVGE